MLASGHEPHRFYNRRQWGDVSVCPDNPTPLIGAALIYLAILLPMVRLVSFLEMRSRGRTSR